MKNREKKTKKAIYEESLNLVGKLKKKPSVLFLKIINKKLLNLFGNKREKLIFLKL